MTATHLDISYGFDLRTACGRSLHGWANITRAQSIKSSTSLHDVTCKRCIAKAPAKS